MSTQQTTPQNPIRITEMIDTLHQLVYAQRAGEDPWILLGFRSSINSSWCYQSLHWNCRGGRHQYYKGLINLYRRARKDGLTDRSLRYLAWGDNRLAHHGYAIRSPSWHDAEAIRAKLRACVQFEEEVRDLLKIQFSHFLPNDWIRIEKHSSDTCHYLAHIPEIGARGKVIIVRALMQGSISVRVESGVPGISHIAGTPTTSDQLRLRREEVSVVVSKGEMPIQRVSEAINIIRFAIGAYQPEEQAAA